MCICMCMYVYVFVHNILEKSGAKGINDAKTLLFKYQTSVNTNNQQRMWKQAVVLFCTFNL